MEIEFEKNKFIKKDQKNHLPEAKKLKKGRRRNKRELKIIKIGSLLNYSLGTRAKKGVGGGVKRKKKEKTKDSSLKQRPE